MLTFTYQQLRDITFRIFQAAGAPADEAAIVADALVDANEAGIDSHGVQRIPQYVGWMEKGQVNVGVQIKVVRETEVLAVIDGGWGFGQVVGRKAMQVAIEKASNVGVGVVSVGECCHVGRVGEYPLLAAGQGMVAIMYANSHGAGKFVAPWGGIDRRLSANPVSIAIPRSSSPPILVDISTCAIAEGKVRSLLNGEKQLPPNCVIDANGQPSTNPADLYGPPQGALLPFGGHKGFGLGLVIDILAGALSGAGCSRSTTERPGNGFLAFVIDIARFRDREAFDRDVEELLGYVKSSRLAPGISEILIPGEPEIRERERRRSDGIPIDDETWRQIVEVVDRYGLTVSTPVEAG
jgi:uncharacterized oxidoreductase